MSVTDAMKPILLKSVAMAGDQTDGLVKLLELGDRDQRTIDLVISHLRYLQRNYAKATDSEITYMEFNDNYKEIIDQYKNLL